MRGIRSGSTTDRSLPGSPGGHGSTTRPSAANPNHTVHSSTLVSLDLTGSGGPRTQVPPRARTRVIALTRMSPPAESGLSHWSTRTLAGHLKRREGISVSWHYIARIWREENLK
ncbi:helix-turn-helix domain-containing protein, partial [Streptomyces sp. NPDC001982]|uniref:helix-turn-helix domain-containing protein n=1 Tax=Streptomyces sp. NPDC001982 TaxID=3154405 RepID=UPI0033341809